jgi:hypothetical protein
MTKAEQLRHAADIYEALEQGKEIEFESVTGGWLTIRGITSGISNSPEFAPEKWRIAPKPATRPWNCPADVPMPICWIRVIGANDYGVLIIAKHPSGIYSLEDVEDDKTASFNHHLWRDLSGFEHSTDGCNWHPCTVEVKQ